MGLLWMLLVGFVIGMLARAVMPGTQQLGLLLTTGLGVAGSFLAGLIGQTLGLYRAGQGSGFIASVLGALLVLYIYGKVAAKKDEPPQI